MYYVGVDLHKKGDIHAAMHEYSKVLRLDPNNTSARFNRGLVYRHVGATDLAITEFDGHCVRLNVKLARSQLPREYVLDKFAHESATVTVSQ